MVSVQRDAIVKSAESWIGTPYAHFQCCKGAGVDCAHLIIGVGKDVGIFPEDFKVPYYSPQWLLHEKAALLVETMQVHNFIEKSIDTRLPGDVLVFEISEILCHTAIFIGEDRAIHAHLTRGNARVREFRLLSIWIDAYLKRCFAFPGLE